jgi:hypothetical protein
MEKGIDRRSLFFGLLLVVVVMVLLLVVGWTWGQMLGAACLEWAK